MQKGYTFFTSTRSGCCFLKISGEFSPYKLVRLEAHTGILPGFRFVSRTCHEALSTIHRRKVSVSVFFTFVTVQKCAKNALSS